MMRAAGRCSPDVARLTVTWPTLGTHDASIANGLWVADVLTDKQPPEDEMGNTTFTAYDQAGQVLDSGPWFPRGEATGAVTGGPASPSQGRPVGSTVSGVDWGQT
jgi:hypothetical protein